MEAFFGFSIVIRCQSKVESSIAIIINGVFGFVLSFDEVITCVSMTICQGVFIYMPT